MKKVIVYCLLFLVLISYFSYAQAPPPPPAPPAFEEPDTGQDQAPAGGRRGAPASSVIIPVQNVSGTQEIAQVQEDITINLDTLSSRIASIEEKTTTLEDTIENQANDITDLKTSIDDIRSEMRQELQKPAVVPVFTAPFTTMLIINIILLLGIITFVLLMREKKPKASENLKNYLRNHLSQKYPFDKLKPHLLQQGWSEEEVDLAYNEVAHGP